MEATNNWIFEGIDVKKIMVLVFVSVALVVSCESSKKQEFSKERLLEFSEKCSKAGKLYFQEFSREIEGQEMQFPKAIRDNYLWDDPQYHYNSRLNTCLVHIRFVRLSGSLSIHHNQVVDIFSNKVILRGLFLRDRDGKEELIEMPDDVPNYTSIEYFKQKNKLFGE